MSGEKPRLQILLFGAGRNKSWLHFYTFRKTIGMKKGFFMLAFHSLYRQKLIAVSFIGFLFVSCLSHLKQKSQATGEHEYVYDNVQWQPGNESNILTAALSLPSAESPANILSVKISQRGMEVLAANFKSINREYWYEVIGKIIYLFWNSNGNSSQLTIVKVKLNGKK